MANAHETANKLHWQQVNQCVNSPQDKDLDTFISDEKLLYFDEDDASSISFEVNTNKIEFLAGIHMNEQDPAVVAYKLKEYRAALDEAIAYFDNFDVSQRQSWQDQQDDYYDWTDRMNQQLQPRRNFNTNF